VKTDRTGATAIRKFLGGDLQGKSLTLKTILNSVNIMIAYKIIMSESTGGISCPKCGMSFDTMDELGRHSRQQHATITESKGYSKENTAHNPSIEERVQTRTEEKGKGETA
jgi:uncharacterized C2H2 Zn-finger protein